MFNPSTQHGSRSRQGKPERFWGWGWGKAVRRLEGGREEGSHELGSGVGRTKG